MRSGLGARQVQFSSAHFNSLKKHGSDFTSLVALIFPPEFNVLLFDFSPA